MSTRSEDRGLGSRRGGFLIAPPPNLLPVMFQDRGVARPGLARMLEEWISGLEALRKGNNRPRKKWQRQKKQKGYLEEQARKEYQRVIARQWRGQQESVETCA
ncbi:unnamed protein product [Arctia plantaginis]|uniref:Uncharacterized protein n=1 Tax=Arctia plantaginis TaxID=874455 RepID=A0A8S1B404_ARCPL|nr:unnamed protein product [Arctia plantaginis]